MAPTFSDQTSSSQAEHEANTLVSILRLWGIEYLTGGVASLDPAEQAVGRTAATALIQRLAQCDNARVQDACISLLLLHPERADAVLDALQTSEGEIAEQIIVHLLATLYLQQLWSIRLTLAFGHAPNFPEQPFAFLWRSRNLPSPASYHGSWGLLALQDAEQHRIGLPLTVLGDWQNQVDHLLRQEEAKQRPAPSPLFPREVPTEQDEQECHEMSMRPNVDKANIERFLRTFGQNYRKAGRLYLTGGAALVHAGIRSGVTQDIDVEVSSGDMLQIIDQMKLRLNLNIETASPKDFMPVPSQWTATSQYVGRYGQVDVFYFDFYSIALSKIDRGNRRDLQDVQLLVQQGIIDLNELDTAFQEVLALGQTQQGRASYPRFDSNAFATRYRAIRQNLSHP